MTLNDLELPFCEYDGQRYLTGYK